MYLPTLPQSSLSIFTRPPSCPNLTLRSLNMASRVHQIALQVRKLAQATGVKAHKNDTGKEPSLDGVTSDLDIEALAKSLLDYSRDLDLYLQTLLDPPDLPIANLKSVSCFSSPLHFSLHNILTIFPLIGY